MQYFNQTFLAAIFLIAIALTSCNQEANNKITKQQHGNTTSENLDFMKKLNGKYPYEVKLLNNSVLKKRLKKMLGSQYDYMKNIWEVQSPIEINNGLFYAWAMQAHSGGDPSAVLMVDFNKNVLYVGIRKDKQEKIYSEDGSDAPQKIQDWANEQ